MIFYSSSKPGRVPWLTIGATRALTLVSLLTYPAGSLMLALGPEGRDGLMLYELAGLALILASFVSAWPVLGSQIQRVVADQADKLDEFELVLRQRALSGGYAVFSALVLCAVFYLALASDFGWWQPRSYEEFNGVFWGVFLYAVLLPAALLAWSKDAEGLA